MEDVLGHVAGKDGENYRSEIVDLRNKLRKEKEKAFYEAKHVSEFDDKTLTARLQDLRAHGIGILDGELEHLARDDAWINAESKKLNLERVYELRELLSAGKSMEELFDLTPLNELLDPILGRKGPTSE